MRDVDFDQLVRRHHRAVSTYARALTSDRTVAEDAVQETFLRAWRYLDSFRGQGSFEGWLLTICRNCVIDLAQRAPNTFELDVDHDRPEPPDTTNEVFALIDDLPLPQREVIVLCAWLGYDYEDAATLLGVPIGTVRSRLHRARAALAGHLGERDRRAAAG